MKSNKRKIVENEDLQVEPSTRDQHMVTYNETAEQIRTYLCGQYVTSKGSPDLSVIRETNYVRNLLRDHLYEQLDGYKRMQNEENKKGNGEKKPRASAEPKPSVKKAALKLKAKDFFRDPAYHPADPTRASTSSSLPDTVERLRIKKDLSAANQEYHAVPIYCDLGITSTDFCLSDQFTYARKNCVDDPDVDPKGFAKICCACEEECLPETCDCLKLQKKAFGNAVEYLGGGFVRDSYGYWKQNTTINMEAVALIMCGPLCRCSQRKEQAEDGNLYSTCRNHIDQLRNTYRFEIFRRDIILGFGIRALNHFEIGQVISEFVGKLRPETEVHQDDRFSDYGLEICGQGIQQVMDKIVSKLPGMTDDQLNLYETSEEKTRRRKKKGRPKQGTKTPSQCWVIDPHGYGNLSRFFSHGCFSNIVPFRVIVNYLHPHYHRIFFKAVVPIPAGTELVFNYGKDYINRANFRCRCGTIMCREDKDKVDFWKSLKNSEFFNINMDLVKYYRSLIKKKTQFYEDNQHIAEEYKGVEEVNPPGKKPAKEPDDVRQYNAKSREIYGNLVKGRQKKYAKQQAKHFKEMLNAYLPFEKMADEKKEIDNGETASGPVEITLEDSDEEEETDEDVEKEEEEEESEEEEEQEDGDQEVEEITSDVEIVSLDD